jgi:endo-1,4-beta-xylanase
MALFRVSIAVVLFLILAFMAQKYTQRSKPTTSSVLSTELTSAPDVLLITPEGVEVPAQEPTPEGDSGDLLRGNWNYMPGVEQKPEGLLVRPIDRVLMEQDGRLAEANSPINLYGAHVENLSPEFEITFIVDQKNAHIATMQLYGRIPIIADEFKVQRESVRLDIEKEKLTVHLWNGYRQQPNTQVFLFESSVSHKITITKKDGRLSFTRNDALLGSIDESGVFASKQIWFGLDAKGGMWQMTSLKAHALNNGALSISNLTDANKNHAENGLQKLAMKKRPGFLVGSAMALGPLVTDSQYRQVALDNSVVGSMTPENGMKMINLQPQRGLYTFGETDALIELAKKNGLVVHGHTLVFGEANPPWFNSLPVSSDEDKASIEQIMRDHIKTVLTYFGDKVLSWDVVNEPLSDEDGSIYRNHKWYQAMGDQYIIKAFEEAHKANPHATLFINEYGLEEAGDRWETFLRLMEKLKIEFEKKSIPLDKIGVGFQAHIYEKGDRINKEVLKRHIRDMENLGFKVQISENDVYSGDGDSVQANQYLDVFSACFEEKNCIRWNAWILSDRYNYWKDDSGSIEKGIDGLFDVNIKPRPAYLRLQQFLSTQ